MTPGKPIPIILDELTNAVEDHGRNSAINIPEK
jgi:hypothetical protein